MAFPLLFGESRFLSSLIYFLDCFISISPCLISSIVVALDFLSSWLTSKMNGSAGYVGNSDLSPSLVRRLKIFMGQVSCP